jgi:hypothetical protein
MHEFYFFHALNKTCAKKKKEFTKKVNKETPPSFILSYPIAIIPSPIVFLNLVKLPMTFMSMSCPAPMPVPVQCTPFARKQEKKEQKNSIISFVKWGEIRYTNTPKEKKERKRKRKKTRRTQNQKRKGERERKRNTKKKRELCGE